MEKKLEPHFSLLTVITLASILSPITWEICIPALPEITTDLGTTHFYVQLSLALYMLGFAFCQLLYGPLFEIFGRKKLLLSGLTISFSGGLICAFASGVYLILLGRLLQGIGMASCVIIRASLLKEYFSENKLAKTMSQIYVVIFILIAFVPLIGSYLQLLGSWRLIFYVLSVYTFINIILIWQLVPKDNKTSSWPLTRQSSKQLFIESINNYLSLLYDRKFIGYCLFAFIYCGSSIAYYTSAPFLLQNGLNLSSVQYSYINLSLDAALAISAFTNSRLTAGYESKKLILLACIIMLVSSVISVSIAAVGYFSILSLIIPTGIFFFGINLLFLNSFALTLSSFPNSASAAGALYGCIQVLGGTFASFLMAVFHRETLYPLAILFLAAAIFALISYRFMDWQADRAL